MWLSECVSTWVCLHLCASTPVCVGRGAYCVLNFLSLCNTTTDLQLFQAHRSSYEAKNLAMWLNMMWQQVCYAFCSGPVIWYVVSLMNEHLNYTKNNTFLLFWLTKQQADSFKWPVACSACLQLEAQNFYCIPSVHCNTFSSAFILLFFRGIQFSFHSLHFFSEQAVCWIYCELHLLPFEIIL